MAYLEMRGITRRFPGVLANDQVDLIVEQGEIHALVGENGAGKSTLMNVLYGMFPPDAGEILLDGELVQIPNPQAAIRLGIGMVHQHFQLVPSLTVAENVALGYEPRRGMFVDKRRMVDRVREISASFGLQVDPLARVADLSVGVQQRVEILKLLYREARLLIFDEPTAVLTPQESQELFQVMRRLVEQDRTAIFITHKLPEVKSVCRRGTVLRRGKMVGTFDVAETSAEEIAMLMVGRDVQRVKRVPRQVEDDPRLELINISADDERELPALREVSLTVHAGEILGIAGVEGNGQVELAEVLIGRRPPLAGRILLAGQEITELSGRQRRELGLAMIPEDRNRQGISREMSIWENVIANNYYRPPLAVRRLINVKAARGWAQQLITDFDIRTPSETIQVGKLSGGNAQKVIIARELAHEPLAIVAAQPTRGLDVGAARFVHEQLLTLRDAGVAVLLISADLDELMAMADSIAVLFEGRIQKVMVNEEVSREALGLLMAGKSAVG